MQLLKALRRYVDGRRTHIAAAMHEYVKASVEDELVVFVPAAEVLQELVSLVDDAQHVPVSLEAASRNHDNGTFTQKDERECMYVCV